MLRFYTILGFLFLAFLVGGFWFDVLGGLREGGSREYSGATLSAVLVFHVVFIVMLRDQIQWMKDNPGRFLGEFSSSAAGVGGLIGFGVLVAVGRGARAFGKGATDWTILGWVLALLVSAIATVLVYRGVKQFQQARGSEGHRRE